MRKRGKEGKNLQEEKEKEKEEEKQQEKEEKGEIYLVFPYM